ncbi:CIC11C00000003324 [Sungouiella intermedia]|uniref:CIC11C00000003324 n=1 Tax=Sungouiella intermedia TaxID=45354 RepID=A0A1L0C146_9ASCO|nr:CIC11C00000003324 [[Candida] intermedia]
MLESESLSDKARRFYRDVVEPNMGVSLLLLSQFLNSIMILTCKLLEGDKDFETPLHPVQILFVRMFVTYVLCVLYMVITRSVEDAPFGPKSQRPFLLLRGIIGFFGVFGLYYSLQYLSLSDAVSITFLIPMVTAFFAFIMLGEKYSVLEAVCAVLSLAGVLLIAKPDFLFGTDTEVSHNDSAESSSSKLRLLATGVGLIGVCGASGVYVVLRKIGKLAHPLISVSYFALLTCVITFVATLVTPSLSFQMPTTLYQWFLFFLIGVSGFFMQFCLAAGLQREKAGKSSLMIYFNMVFALFWDFAIWGHLPGILSILGMALIIGNAYIVIKYKPTVPEEERPRDLEHDAVKYHRAEDIVMEEFNISDDDSASSSVSSDRH